MVEHRPSEERWRYLVEGEAGVVRSSEGAETVHIEVADGVAAVRGELLAEEMDAILICTSGDRQSCSGFAAEDSERVSCQVPTYSLKARGLS